MSKIGHGVGCRTVAIFGGCVMWLFFRSLLANTLSLRTLYPACSLGWVEGIGRGGRRSKGRVRFTFFTSNIKSDFTCGSEHRTVANPPSSILPSDSLLFHCHFFDSNFPPHCRFMLLNSSIQKRAETKKVLSLHRHCIRPRWTPRGMRYPPTPLPPPSPPPLTQL